MSYVDLNVFKINPLYCFCSKYNCEYIYNVEEYITLRKVGVLSDTNIIVYSCFFFFGVELLCIPNRRTHLSTPKLQVCLYNRTTHLPI